MVCLLNLQRDSLSPFYHPACDILLEIHDIKGYILLLVYLFIYMYIHTHTHMDVSMLSTRKNKLGYRCTSTRLSNVIFLKSVAAKVRACKIPYTVP